MLLPLLFGRGVVDVACAPLGSPGGLRDPYCKLLSSINLGLSDTMQPAAATETPQPPCLWAVRRGAKGGAQQGVGSMEVLGRGGGHRAGRPTK